LATGRTGKREDRDSQHVSGFSAVLMTEKGSAFLVLISDKKSTPR